MIVEILPNTKDEDEDENKTISGTLGSIAELLSVPHPSRAEVPRYTSFYQPGFCIFVSKKG